MIAREDVDGLVDFIHDAKVPHYYAPGADAYLLLRAVQMNDPDSPSLLSESFVYLRELLKCKDWGVDPAASRLIRVSPLDFDTDEPNGDSNGYHDE